VFNPQNLGVYSYGALNPIKYVDPDGNSVKIYVTGIAVGESYVNTRKSSEIRAEGPNVNVKITVPLYTVFVENDSGSTFTFKVSRHAFRDKEGNGGIEVKTFTGTGLFKGAIRHQGDGTLGERIELRDYATNSHRIRDADGGIRENVQLHIGPGCSEACLLMQGSGAGRDSIMNKIEGMRNEDQQAGHSDQIYIYMSPIKNGSVKVPEYP
jgi:hypothetical protein